MYPLQVCLATVLVNNWPNIEPGENIGIPLKFLGLATPESNVHLFLTPDPETHEWGQWRVRHRHRYHS